MTIPSNLGFGDDEQMLRDAARKLLADKLPTDRLHRLVAGDPDPNRAPRSAWDRALWQQMAELGWTALLVPERAGGAGMSLVAAAALVEEGGRAALPAPLVPTLQASVLLRACAETTAAETLALIAAGKTATLALDDARGAWRGDGADVELHADGTLHGTAPQVQDAAKADFIVLKARSAHGSCLVRVDSGARGLELIPDSIVDLTRDQAHLALDGAIPAAMLAPPGSAAAAIAQAEPALFVLLAADMCGAGAWQLESTIEYARVRKQFDRPIGFFQAIKHPLVDFMIQLDQARSHLYHAACTIEHEPAGAARAAHMAKAAASEMAVYGSGRALQSHGGIGFTWECFQHLYFKRQMHSQALLGDAVWHRARLAEMLLGAIGTAA
jgi:alkylation response protein AidB-like acyl-CoA dehydrogenase